MPNHTPNQTISQQFKVSYNKKGLEKTFSMPLSVSFFNYAKAK
jgi:hypothetical protein